MVVSRMKLFLIIILIGMIKSDKFMSSDYINDNIIILDDEKKNIDFDEILVKVTKISQQCLVEVLNLKNIITNFELLHFNSDSIYRATKNLISRFIVLESICNINLPKIDLTKFNSNKFIKPGCMNPIKALVTKYNECVTGKFDNCSNVLDVIGTIGKCLNKII